MQGTEERYRNKGAYIVLEPPNFDHPVFRSFEAITPRPQVSINDHNFGRTVISLWFSRWRWMFPFKF